MTLRFVAIADSETLVSTEIAFAARMINSARHRPAAPVTKPRRRKRMMPRIVRMLGVNTPPKVPNALPFAAVDARPPRLSISLNFIR